MRELEAADSETAQDAIAYFIARIRREIGGLAATIGGFDAIVFTGGIGENSVRIREAGPRKGNTPRVLAALQQAHVKAVDDWIPFDRYLQINTPYTLPYFAPVSGDNFFCKGPDFLLRVYANALSAAGQQVQLLRGRRNRRALRPQVLHFGSSYIVADRFTAEWQSDPCNSK